MGVRTLPVETVSIPALLTRRHRRRLSPSGCKDDSVLGIYEKRLGSSRRAVAGTLSGVGSENKCGLFIRCSRIP